MDPQLYKNEIDRLSKEISDIKSDTEKPCIKNILHYKYYFIIFVSVGLLIYLIKPKCILKIEICAKTSYEAEPEIVVSYKKFFLYWFIISLITCIAYYFYGLYKKNN